MTLSMNIIRRSILKSDWLYSLELKLEKLYTVSKNKTGSWLWLRSWTFYCQIQENWIEESRENHRPFRYDLNQSLYYYTVEVTNRSKGLDLKDKVPKELWTEVHDIVQEAVIKTISKKKKCKKANWLSEEAFQIAEKRKEEKWKAKEKRKVIPIWMQSSEEQQGEIRKPSSVINAKK